MLNHFTFNGHSTGELGLLVSGINIYGSPSRIVEKVTIPYRSGDLIIDTGAYTNYMLTYTVDIMDNTKATAEAISEWLLNTKGYCELTDTYNPEIYRVASYYNQLDYTLSALYRYGKATITFDCKPQKYLTANQPVSLSSTLSEETSYSLSTPAMPLPLTLEGNTTQGANPTPEAPQEIHSVKGDNEIRVVGFNLFDKNAMVKGYYISDNDGNQQWDGGSNSTNFIQVIPNQKYYIKSEATSGKWGAWYDIDKNYISGIVGVNTIFTAPSNAHFMRMTVSRPTTGNPDTFCINVSDTEKNGTYEPYRSQVYPINLPTENLFTSYTDGYWDRNTGEYTPSGNWKASNKIPVQPNTEYIIGNVNINGYSLLWKSDGTITYYGSSNPERVINTGSNGTYIAFYTNNANAEKTQPYVTKGRGTNIQGYSIELNALGNYKDYFHKANGKWYLHKAIDKVDMGTLTWVRRTTNIFGSSLPNGTDVTADISAHMSNYFPIQYVTGMTGTQINTIAIYKISNITSTTSVYVSLADIDTVGDLTTWFNSHATELYYPLATPTNTEITDATLISQLNAISKAKTYDGSTTIVQEGTDAQFKLSMPVPTEISSEYFGEPIITVSETGTIVWNDSLIKVNSAPVTINSQTLQCYYYSENKNNDVEINEFPKYEQGENYIGSTMALTVVPNYWKL